MYDKEYFISVHLFVSCIKVAKRFGSFVSPASYLNANTITRFRIYAECHLGNLTMIRTVRNILLIIIRRSAYKSLAGQEGNKLQPKNSGFIQDTPHEAQYTS